MQQEIVTGALCQARLEYTLFPSTTKLEQSFGKRRWVAEERRKDEDPHRILVVWEWIIEREILRSKEKNLFTCERKSDIKEAEIDRRKNGSTCVTYM